MQPSLLCIAQSFSPETTPTAIRAGKLVENLGAQWRISVVTEAERYHAEPTRVEVVGSWRPSRLTSALRRMRLNKLLELVVWPDESIFWVVPAILAGRRLIREFEPRAIVVFMMPYSAGLAGIVLSRLTRLPLILNLDDSPTCDDMHPHFPTRLHYHMAKALEDFYARSADAVVYVSETNLKAVRARQDERTRHKFHLVRYGADREDFHHPSDRPAEGRTTPHDEFEIAYVGAMSGWWALVEQSAPGGRLRRIYGAWNRLGWYEQTSLDHRTSSPVIIGRAMIGAIDEHRDWAGRVHMTAYGNPYPPAVVSRALAGAGVQDVVSVLGPVPHDQVAGIINRADLLFITLPMRLDGSRGGRISAKTYEYLTTDRPILAAVPHGENWDYLADKPGVWLVGPYDRRAMQEVISELAEAKFAGKQRTFERDQLHGRLSYESRAAEFAQVIQAVTERGRAEARNVAGRRPTEER